MSDAQFPSLPYLQALAASGLNAELDEWRRKMKAAKFALEALAPPGGWPTWPTMNDATPKMHPEPLGSVLAFPWNPWLLTKANPHTWPLGIPRSEELLSPTMRDRIFEAALEFLAGIDLWTPEGRAYAAWRRGAWKQN